MFESNSGYLCVSIKNSTHYIHRLVALAYLPNPENKKEVNHINLDKHDNRVENLEWISPSDNVKHAKRNCKNTSKTSSNAGLLYKDTKLIKHFDSLQQAKIYCKVNFNCSLSTIGTLNVNYKNRLIYLRDTNKFDVTDFWNEYQKKYEKNKLNHVSQNKSLKGKSGKLYQDDICIGVFNSIRDANKFIHHDLKRINSGFYKVLNYTYIE